MRNQKETLRIDAPRFSRSQVPVIGILIELVIGLIFYTTLAFVNYTVGGPRLRGNMDSLVHPLPASLMLVFAIMYLARGISKMHKEQRPWHTRQFMFMGIGYICAFLSSLVIGEGLGNSLLSPVFGWSLAGLLLVSSVACIFTGNIRNPEHPEHIGEATPQPKEAREE
jgi:multisubunit Na+/H+ antiporter MnhB subunit